MRRSGVRSSSSPPKTNFKASHNPRNGGFFYCFFHPQHNHPAFCKQCFPWLDRRSDCQAQQEAACHGAAMGGLPQRTLHGRQSHRLQNEYRLIRYESSNKRHGDIPAPNGAAISIMSVLPRVASIQGLPPVGPHGNSIVPAHSRSSRSE